MNENGETMNIKQYISNIQSLIIAGFINQKYFDYDSINKDTRTKMYGRTTTDNIHFLIELTQLGDPLEFLIYRWNKTRTRTEIADITSLTGNLLIVMMLR